MRWGFAERLALVAVMKLQEKNYEKKARLFATQKFYQECYEEIADDSKRVYETVSWVVQKASRRYIPSEIGLGCQYLPLYCFALIIEKQGRITKEQKKIVRMYFDSMRLSFSYDAYITSVINGTEVSDFRKIIAISHNYAGGFWVNFFRALYKSGTQNDLQEFVDCATSIIMRFSVLGNLESELAGSTGRRLIEDINYQINQVREISIKEIDWLGVIPISDRLEEMKTFYQKLINDSSITESISEEELAPLLELLVLNCICDIVMLTKQPKSVKLQMLNEVVDFFELQLVMTPEEYVKHIANGTDAGMFYKEMFSACEQLGVFWEILLKMGIEIDQTQEVLGITNDILSILLQVENYLDEMYNFLGAESIAKNYMLHIMRQLATMCDEEE